MIDSHAVNALGHLGFSNSYMRVTVTNQFELAQWYVQPADTPNITNFQNALLNQAIARNTDFLFLDNINGIAYGYYPPDDVNAFITHISQICGKFNANGYGAVFNIGKLPAWQRDFGPLGTTYEAAFDTALGDNGAYVEQSFRFRDEFDTTQQELASRRTLLHQGALTVLSPSPQGYSVLSCVEWTAALAMIMREPGDSVFVVTDKDINNSGITWKDWPGIYGPPNSAIHFGNVGNTNWFFERTFTYQSGEITAVHIHVPGPSSVNILPVANLVDYHLIPGREPTRGTWDDVAHTYNALADPNLDCDTDDGMSDSFVLGKNPGPPGIYEAIMAVDVLFTRPASCP